MKTFDSSYMNLLRLPIFPLLVALGTGGCKEAPAGPDRLASISGLQAYSADSNSVGLAWTGTAAINTGYMADHEVVARSGSQTLQTSHFPNSATSALVQGLLEGSIYIFEITVRANDTSPYQNSLPVSLSWSPARRFTAEAGTGALLQLYESDSPGNQHAVRCYSDSAGGPTLLSLASPDYPAMDMCLFSTPAGLILRSGALYAQTPTGRNTKFSERLPVNASSLDNPQPSAPGLETYTLSAVNIPPTTTSGIIFFARTEDDHYLRILVLRGARDGLIEGTAPNRFITVQISYQSVPGIHFAHRNAGERSNHVSLTTLARWRG